MIFCVEDDESIRSLELYTLRSAGFEAGGFPDGDSFWKTLRTDCRSLFGTNRPFLCVPSPRQIYGRFH